MSASGPGSRAGARRGGRRAANARAGRTATITASCSSVRPVEGGSAGPIGLSAVACRVLHGRTRVGRTRVGRIPQRRARALARSCPRLGALHGPPPACGRRHDKPDPKLVPPRKITPRGDRRVGPGVVPRRPSCLGKALAQAWQSTNPRIRAERQNVCCSLTASIVCSALEQHAFGRPSFPCLQRASGG